MGGTQTLASKAACDFCGPHQPLKWLMVYIYMEGLYFLDMAQYLTFPNEGKAPMFYHAVIYFCMIKTSTLIVYGMAPAMFMGLHERDSDLTLKLVSIYTVLEICAMQCKNQWRY